MRLPAGESFSGHEGQGMKRFRFPDFFRFGDHFLAEEVCPLCGRPAPESRHRTGPCSFCESRLPRIDPPYCRRCGYPVLAVSEGCRLCREKSFAFETHRSLFLYADYFFLLYREYKFRKIRSLVFWLASCREKEIRSSYAHCHLVPVPYRRKKRKKEGGIIWRLWFPFSERPMAVRL